MDRGVFLARTDRKYDVIIAGPSASLDSATSSLLYSVEFYELIKSRLAEGGIVQSNT